jgi:hypothetical protein
MMSHEFNNRIAAQRAILRVVNSNKWTEPLFGLSGKAIDRWVLANMLDASSPLVRQVRRASEQLFFLANRSQEQITDEYRIVQTELIAISDSIRAELAARL